MTQDTMTDQHKHLTNYLSGGKLYGDDFLPGEIAEWYEDEAEAYAGLGAADRDSYSYHYHSLNKRLGFSYLGERTFKHALGLGSAYGDEFLPIIKKIKRLSILDPSDAFKVDSIEGVPVTYGKPRPSGDLPFAEASVDLITCFGVLHHIPNVTHVIREMGRCLAPGGIALIREPTVSMGDWTKPRVGLTRRERGIPPAIMRSAISGAGLEVVRCTPFGFRPAVRAWGLISRASFYNSGMAITLDVLLSRLTSWNHRYHRKTILNRFAPSSAFWVLTRNAGNMR